MENTSLSDLYKFFINSIKQFKKPDGVTTLINNVDVYNNQYQKLNEQGNAIPFAGKSVFIEINYLSTEVGQNYSTDNEMELVLHYFSRTSTGVKTIDLIDDFVLFDNQISNLTLNIGQTSNINKNLIEQNYDFQNWYIVKLTFQFFWKDFSQYIDGGSIAPSDNVGVKINKNIS